MPTARAITFLITAFLLYLFANQTQVGWLYVISALLAAVVVGSWVWGVKTLQHIHIRRKAGKDSGERLYEGDEIEISLRLESQGRRPTVHLSADERCPLAAPDSQYKDMRLFIPHIPAGGGVELDYSVEIYRRGLHSFPPVKLVTSAPFGLFRRRREVEAPARFLVYPEVREIGRLDLLNRRLALQYTDQRPGVGVEFLGVRPYRVGDSPRHIHWRSVARTGELISKEFAFESQPGLSVVIDMFTHAYPQAADKHTPFEWAVKAAASLGDYALRRGYPLHPCADREALPPPSGPVGRDAFLQYLARLEPTGQRPIGEILASGEMQPFLAVILPWPDESAFEPLASLHQRGYQIQVLLFEGSSFPCGGPSPAPLLSQLSASGISTQLIQFSLEAGLSWEKQIEAASSRIQSGRGLHATAI